MVILSHLYDPRHSLLGATAKDPKQPNLRTAMESGQVALYSACDLLLAAGLFKPDLAAAKLNALCEQAAIDGYPTVRFIVDMTWGFEAALTAQRIAELESQLAAALPPERVCWISLFDEQYFKPAVILVLLPCYLTVLRGESLYHNIFWLPREQNASENPQATALAQAIQRIEGFGKADQQLLERSAALNRSAAELEMLYAIIDSMGDGVFVVDELGKMVFCNKSSENIIGYGVLNLPMEERVRVIGNFLPDGITPYPIDQLPIARAIRGESTDGIEYIVRNPNRPNGVWVSVTGRPLRNKSGNICGGVIVFRNITQQKLEAQAKQALEDQMLKTQKLESLGVMAGGIAHDLNNLLVGVMGNVDLALLEVKSADPLHSRLSLIQVAARRLSDLTHQLLAYSGRGAAGMTNIDLTELVQEMVDLLRPAIAKRVQLEFDLADDLPPVLGDPTQLRQVVMNLITNASDAIGQATGTVKVKISLDEVSRTELNQSYLGEGLEAGRCLVLKVSDNGVGITAETQSKIFEPFFTTKVTGRGLGLAAVLGIVKRHAGALKLESEVEKGTTFTLYFPVSTTSGKQSVTTTSEKSAFTCSGKLLLVDDEEAVAEVSAEMLRISGFEVEVAYCGKEAIAAFSKAPESFSAAILDITLPDIDGFQLLAELRAIRSDLRAIFSSGYAQSDIAKENAVLADGYLQKPYGHSQLLSAISDIL